jgi:hypothetical protein
MDGWMDGWMNACFVVLQAMRAVRTDWAIHVGLSSMSDASAALSSIAAYANGLNAQHACISATMELRISLSCARCGRIVVRGTMCTQEDDWMVGRLDGNTARWTNTYVGSRWADGWMGWMDG